LIRIGSCDPVSGTDRKEIPSDHTDRRLAAWPSGRLAAWPPGRLAAWPPGGSASGGGGARRRPIGRLPAIMAPLIGAGGGATGLALAAIASPR